MCKPGCLQGEVPTVRLSIKRVESGSEMPAPWSQNAVSHSEQGPQAAESSSELEPATVVPAALVPEVERMLQASLPSFGVELSCSMQRGVQTVPWLTYLAAWACLRLLFTLLWCLKCACLWQGTCSFSNDIGILSELFVLHVFLPASLNMHTLTGFQLTTVVPGNKHVLHACPYNS